MKRKSWMGVLLVMAVLMAGLTGWTSSAVGSDPEPYIDPNIQYHFDPGPGWPEGWVEPAAPTELTAEAIEEFKVAQGMTGPGEVRPERLEFRVLSPLPDWTKEYPYEWRYEILYCGTTGYAYYYPDIEPVTIYNAFGETYGSGKAGSGANCTFGPINSISLHRKMTEEEKEQRRLDDLSDRDVQLARGSLEACRASDTDASYESIYVCFNYGSASPQFDVPAYLDVAVGRVRVPIRFVSEMMGAQVEWDQATETVTIHFPSSSREIVRPVMKPGFQPIDIWTPNGYTIESGHFTWTLETVHQPERTITLQIGSDTALVDGLEVKIDAPPVVLPPGRTMVPVRFIAEAMGAKVYWVGNDPIFLRHDGTLGGRNQVHIYTPIFPYFAAPDWFLETRALKF